jgi:HAD superfamily hydrolase (TIGR01459 family)
MSDTLPVMTRVSFTENFRTLAPGYDLVLCDVWGVVHNGVAAFKEACDALARFRRGGGTVVLITNAPRQNEMVIELMDRLGVPHAAYDAVVSSGDVTRAVIERRRDQRVFHIGPPRDHSIFSGLDIAFAPVESADFAVCSGLFDDETETPEDYRDLAEKMRRRDLFMVCANPDLVVERGTRRLYCAGAVADLYRSLSGEVLYAGKPHRPIYEQALARAAALRGAAIPPARVLAIGDSIRTDLTGAAHFGVDFLFVTAGIHAEEIGGRDNPDPEALAAVFAAAGVTPTAVMHRLVW